MADLDDRIRDLVARAVADAPDAPSLDGTTSPAVPRQSSSTRWIVGGLAGLSAAAALVALFWVASDDVAEPVTPLAPAEATTTTIAPPTTPPDSTVVNSTPLTVEVEVPTPTVLAGPTSTPPPTTAPEPAGGAADATVIRAGPDGVLAVSVDGSAVTITTEPMAVAFGAPDGRVFMQRVSDTRDPDADTSILVYEPGTAELVNMPLPTAALADAPLRLHDLAVVGGDLVLLIEAGPGRCAGFEDCDGSLFVMHADTGEFDVLYEGSMWEAGFGRVHMADTGVIFGEFSAEILSMPFVATVPGSGAAPLDIAALDLEREYADCGTCPSAFSINRSGTTIGWLEFATDDDGVLTHKVIVLATPDGSAISRYTLVDERTDYNGDGLVPAPWLELVDVSAVPGTRAGWMIVNEQPSLWLDPVSPASIDLDAGLIVSSGIEPGTVVTAG